MTLLHIFSDWSRVERWTVILTLILGLGTIVRQLYRIGKVAGTWEERSARMADDVNEIKNDVKEIDELQREMSERVARTEQAVKGHGHELGRIWERINGGAGKRKR